MAVTVGTRAACVYIFYVICVLIHVANLDEELTSNSNTSANSVLSYELVLIKLNSLDSNGGGCPCSNAQSLRYSNVYYIKPSDLKLPMGLPVDES